MPRSKELSERMRAESRARILSAARKLFAERGYFACKVSDIAHEAEMSQGNVYWYFDGKEDLLKTVLSTGFKNLEKMTTEVSVHPGTVKEKLNHLIQRTLTFYREQGEFSTILVFLMSHGGTPLLQEFGFDMLEIGSRYHGNLIPLFDLARSEGVVEDIDSNILIMFYFGFFNGLILTYGADWLGLPEEFIRNAVLRLLGHRLVPEL